MTLRYLLGDVREQLRGMDAESVQCVCTSPPYWGLRDYELPGVEWGDGWVGCLGLEESPERYVAHLVEVFREVRRALRDDGVVWLNLGDSYIGGGGFYPNAPSNQPHAVAARAFGGHTAGAVKSTVTRVGVAGLKPKDLVGIPFRVAFALQADGWHLRAICPWVKRTVMPESVRDRPTTAVEYVFLLSKKAAYFYDAEGVKVARAPSVARPKEGRNFRNSDPFFSCLRAILDGGGGLLSDEDGAPRAFVVNPKPFKGAHFATWPPSLVEPMIRAGTSETGECSTCGAPWRRRTGRPCKACAAFIPTQGKSCGACGHVNDWKAERRVSEAFGTTDWSTPGRATPRKLTENGKQGAVPAQQTLDAGWLPSCSCTAPARPQTVLDPFGGSGTTALVSRRLGRAAVYIDANADYLDIAQRRLAAEGFEPEEVAGAVEALPDQEAQNAQTPLNPLASTSAIGIGSSGVDEGLTAFLRRLRA